MLLLAMLKLWYLTQTLDQHLAQLVSENYITRETAREVAVSKEFF